MIEAAFMALELTGYFILASFIAAILVGILDYFIRNIKEW